MDKKQEELTNELLKLKQLMQDAIKQANENPDNMENPFDEAVKLSERFEEILKTI